MIGTIKGKVILLDGNRATVDVRGVGYILEIPEEAAIQLHSRQDEILFYTHLIVKEDALDLYGFLEEKQRDLFKLVITAKGIGPKAGHKIISFVPVETFCQMILAGDVSGISRVPGIGKKGAQQIILDLKKKIGGLTGTGIGRPQRGDASGSHAANREAVSALMALGYNQGISEQAVQKVLQGMPDQKDVQEIVKTALSVVTG